jgi:oligoendopeptidase F
MTPEILTIPQEKLDGFLAEEPKLAVYRHALDEINRERPHILSAEMEALLAQADEMGSAAERIFEMLNNADLKLPKVKDERGEEIQLTQGNYVAKFLESQDQSVRKGAFEAMLSAYRDLRNTLAATLGSQVKRDIFFARRHDSTSGRARPRQYPGPRLRQPDTTVHANLPVLHRYLRLRKRLLGLDELHMYDLYTPMVKEVEYTISYTDAQEQVATALEPLGPDYVAALRQGFTSRWVDIYENQGKRSGAYSWGSYGTNPFVLLNYQGNMDSMFTLAHELGHSMHSYFTRKTSPIYGNYTPSSPRRLTLSEALTATCSRRPKMRLRVCIINHALETYRTTPIARRSSPSSGATPTRAPRMASHPTPGRSARSSKG